MLRGFTRDFKPLEILTEEQVEATHRGILAVLEETGVRFEHERALKLFEKNGCKVDYSEKRVRIPSHLAEACLRRCPSSFTVKARDSKNNLRIGGNTLYFEQSVGLRTVDLDTWEARSATLKEHNDAIRVLDSLDNVHQLVGWELYTDMAGIPTPMAPLEGIASAIRNSTKMQTINYWGATFAIEMAKAVGIDLLAVFDAAPPLTYHSEPCEAVFNFIEAGFPLIINTGPVMGGTSPATIAGSMVSTSAEVMAGLVLAQLIKPGIGVVAANITMPMDMQRGHPAFGAVGQALHLAMFNQVWRSYRVPVYSITGYESSKKTDFQCGYEKALGTLVAALSGANLIEFQGCVHGELTFHPAQAVLDDDIAGWIGRFIEGVEVEDETLAIDLIHEVGPVPGYYLDKEHTRNWWKKEQLIPKVADWESYPEWIKRGKKDALARARESVEEILTTHEVTPLSEHQDREIDRILEDARSYYRQKGIL
jgi:trimethylamine--corrinoid protein Co-methyltransferase